MTSQIRNRNFAGFFSFFDLAFGTFYLPKDVKAEGFGLGDPGYPAGYLGQLLARFRRLRPGAAAPSIESEPL